MDVVTEGVEDEASARALADLGCRMGQGYLYGRPMPLDEAMAAWTRRQDT
jgi:EAL domain-containing protein (putative c-di-GMP-specific phosphodiesterase class I)